IFAQLRAQCVELFYGHATVLRDDHTLRLLQQADILRDQLIFTLFCNSQARIPPFLKDGPSVIFVDNKKRSPQRAKTVNKHSHDVTTSRIGSLKGLHLGRRRETPIMLYEHLLSAAKGQHRWLSQLWG